MGHLKQISGHFLNKPKRESNFWNNNYLGCDSNGDKNSNLSLDKNLNKIKG